MRDEKSGGPERSDLPDDGASTGSTRTDSTPPVGGEWITTPSGEQMWLSDDAVIEVDYDEPEEPTFDLGRGAVMADRLDAFGDGLTERPTASAVAASAHAPAADAPTLTDDVFELVMAQQSEERTPAADTDQPPQPPDAFEPPDEGIEADPPEAEADPPDPFEDVLYEEELTVAPTDDVLLAGIQTDAALADVVADHGGDSVTFDASPAAPASLPESDDIDLNPVDAPPEPAPSSSFDAALQTDSALADSFGDVWQDANETAPADEFSASIDTSAADDLSLDDVAPFDALG